MNNRILAFRKYCHRTSDTLQEGRHRNASEKIMSKNVFFIFGPNTIWNLDVVFLRQNSWHTLAGFALKVLMPNSNLKPISNYFLTACLHLFLKVSLHVHLLKLRLRMTHMCTRDLTPNPEKETGQCQTKGSKQHFTICASSIERPMFWWL